MKISDEGRKLSKQREASKNQIKWLLLKVSAELPESADETKISLTSLVMSCSQQRLDSWKLGTRRLDTRN